MFSDTINAGIYVFQPEIFDFIGPGEVDFSSDVFPRLAAEGNLLYGYVTDGYWEDIGTLEAYARAHQDILDGRVDAEVQGFALRKGIWVGEGAVVDPKAEIEGPALIGDYCNVERGATLGEYTVLGRNVRVGADAYVERAVVHDNAYLGPGVRLRGCVIGRGCDLRRGARVEEGVVVGDECFIGEHARIAPRSEDLPLQDGRTRGHCQLLDRLGVERGTPPLRPHRCFRAGQRGHITRPDGTSVHGVRHHIASWCDGDGFA